MDSDWLVHTEPPNGGEASLSILPASPRLMSRYCQILLCRSKRGGLSQGLMVDILPCGVRIIRMTAAQEYIK